MTFSYTAEKVNALTLIFVLVISIHLLETAGAKLRQANNFFGRIMCYVSISIMVWAVMIWNSSHQTEFIYFRF